MRMKYRVNSPIVVEAVRFMGGHALDPIFLDTNGNRVYPEWIKNTKKIDIFRNPSSSGDCYILISDDYVSTVDKALMGLPSEAPRIAAKGDVIIYKGLDTFEIMNSYHFDNLYCAWEPEKTLTDDINKLILMGKQNGWSTKDVSDKWHTFGELYYHRMILFLTIQKAYPEKSWKSKQHHDGTMFDDSFIVGIETDDGQYSYHYNLKYWDLFKDIKELDKAPEYDGHKPEDIIRLLTLTKGEK